MSSLGWSLAILAIVVIAGVLAHNVYHARVGGALWRKRPAPSVRSGPPGGAALQHVSRAEPTLVRDLADSTTVEDADRAVGPPAEAGEPDDDVPAVRTPFVDDGGSMSGPVVEPGAAPRGEVGAARERPRSAEAETAARAGSVALEVECIALIEIPAALPGERVEVLAQGFRRAGSKPVTLDAGGRTSGASGASDGDGDGVVQPVDDGAWEPPTAGRRYSRIRAKVLLENRHGPLNAPEFSEFATGVQELAEAIGARAEVPDMAPVLDAARRLDASCAALDGQIVVTVESPRAISAVELGTLLGEVGLTERAHNRFLGVDADGAVLFSASVGDAPNRVSFVLDVPRVARERGPLRAMVTQAWECARRIGGRMVDDQGKPLNDANFQRIEEELSARYDALEQAGFAAGSATALRLFN